MWAPIEDYALIADGRSAGLVTRTGALEWLCIPRVDHAACMAALLGDERHGMWVISPMNGPRTTSRSYRDGTMILETEIAAQDGRVRLIDALATETERPTVVRIIEGLEGSVELHVQIVMSFDYGSFRPLVHVRDGRVVATAGPDAVVIDGAVDLRQHEQSTVGNIGVEMGDRVSLTLMHFPSHEDVPELVDAEWALSQTESHWRQWSNKLEYEGDYRDAAERSALIMKSMTFAPTGALLTSPTAALPEILGGSANYDYRYCWLRDSSFAIHALMEGGYEDDAYKWRRWLVRSTATDPSKVQPVFGPTGERRMDELSATWLAGYEGSTPVQLGNAAASQFQLDAYGEIMDALYWGRRLGLDEDEDASQLQRGIADWLQQHWTRPGKSIWELRGPARQYTYSKVMAWVAMDRAVRMVEEFELDGDVEPWRQVRDEIHGEVMTAGWNEEVGAFTQHYGATSLDASLLLVAQSGFLPPDHPRMLQTLEAIEDELLVDGWVWRMRKHQEQRRPADEGAFLCCQCWYIDVLELVGRHDDAVDAFERLLEVSNDVGLLSEQYDPDENRLVGNYPLVLTHLAVSNTARNLGGDGPAQQRAALATE